MRIALNYKYYVNVWKITKFGHQMLILIKDSQKSQNTGKHYQLSESNEPN